MIFGTKPLKVIKMTFQVYDGGIWKLVNSFAVKDAGTWKPVQNAYVKDAGIWKQFYSAVTTYEILVSYWGGKGNTTDNPGTGGAFGGKTDLLCRAPLDATFSWVLGSGGYATSSGQGPPGFNRGGAPRQTGGRSGGIGGASTAWSVNGTVVGIAGGGGSGGQGVNVDFYSAGGQGGNYNNQGGTALSVTDGTGTVLPGGVGGSGFNNGGDGVKGDSAVFPGGVAFGGSSGGGGNGLTGGGTRSGQNAAAGGGGGGGYLLGGNSGGFLGNVSWVPATNTPSTFGQGGIQFTVVATGAVFRYDATGQPNDAITGSITVSNLIKIVPSVASAGVLSGGQAIGSTLTYTPTQYNGFPPPDISWVWYADGAPFQTGGLTYVTTLADANKLVFVRSTATNFAGSASNDSNSVTVGRAPYSQSTTLLGNATWSVPAGVTTIRVTCSGGGTTASGNSANGGTTKATLNATSGETFQINFFGGGPSWGYGDSGSGSSGGGSAPAFGLYTGSTLDQSTLYMIAGGAGGSAPCSGGGNGGGDSGNGGGGPRIFEAPGGGTQSEGGVGGRPYGGDNSDRPGGAGGPLSGGRGSEAKTGRCGDYGGSSSGGGAGWFGGGGVSGDCGPGNNGSGGGGSSRIQIPGGRNPVTLENSQGSSFTASVIIEY